MTRPSDPRSRSGPVPLRRLLDAAAAELQAQPLPPLPDAAVSAVAARSAGVAEPAVAGPSTRRPPSSTGQAPRTGGWAAHRPWAWGGLAACVLLLMGSAWLMLTGGPQGLPAGGLMAADTRPWRETGFLPLVPPERWPAGAEAETAWLVRTELPAERLAALGLPFDPARAALRVPAELLLHPSGEVLAVRLLR